MSILKFEVDYEYEHNEIERDILSIAARKLVDDLNKSDGKKIDERIIQIVDDKLNNNLEPILKDIPSHMITKSCGYGKSEKTTVQEYILESAAKWLTAWVNEKGEPYESSYRNNKKMKRIEYIVRSVLDEEIGELKKEVKKESEKYLQEYDKKVRDIIAENVKEIVTKLNKK